MRKLLFKTVYGSRLYGTNVANSDTDYKSVSVPDLSDLLFNKTQVQDVTTYDPQGNKVEEQDFSLPYYMQLLLSGQTIAVDLLFSPEEYWVKDSTDRGYWDLLVQNRDRFVSKNVMPFVGYARGQAIKYGEKGDRLRTVLDFEKEVKTYYHNEHKNRSDCPDPEWFMKLTESFKNRDGVKLKTETKNGTTVHMIEVVGKTFGDTTAMKLWMEPLDKLVKSFGKRATEAMTTDGHDLKAQYHCVRIIEEARELLTTGFITFPRPEAQLLLSIRRGEMSKAEVESLVTERLALLETDLLSSKLPEKPDHEFANGVVLNIVANFVLDGFHTR